ncbi:MAG: FIST C-terminal domain-containing protein [Spirochaetota bacterium]|nr:FIST C-terminal domain-containing protein [Spirochaetota bacterium]
MKDKDVFYLESPDLLEKDERIISWKNRNPQGGAFVLLAENNWNSIPSIQKVFQNLSLDVVGAVFPELIVDYGFKRSGLIVFLFPQMPSHKIIPNLTRDSSNISSSLEEIVSLDSPDKETLFLVFDSMVGSISSILENIYMELADEVNYLGVNAGSETFRPMACLFDSRDLVQDGVLAIALRDHPGGVVEHGYRVPEKLRLATATQGNRVISIGLRMAYEVYQEILQEHYGVSLTKDNFYENAVHFPFGIIRANNEVMVRIPVQLEEDGSLFCVGEVPANETLTVLKASDSDSPDTIMALKKKVFAEENPGYMLFYCAGRRMHLGDGANEELSNLKDALEGSESYGALSLGEVGSTRQGDYPLFHNAALVLSPWKSL